MSQWKRPRHKTGRRLVFEGLESRHLLTAGIFQNAIDPADVNLDGHRTPMDALCVINFVNGGAPSELSLDIAQPPANYVDVNGDGYATPVDALTVISVLNRAELSPDAAGAAEAEAASVASSASLTELEADAVDVVQTLAEAEAGATPPSGNIFEQISGAIRELVARGRVGNAKATELVQEAWGQDTRDVLDLAREAYRQNSRDIVEDVRQRNWDGLRSDAEDYGKIAKEVDEHIRNNVDLVQELEEARREYNQKLAEHIADLASRKKEPELALNEQAVDQDQMIARMNGLRDEKDANKAATAQDIQAIRQHGGSDSRIYSLFGSITTSETFPRDGGGTCTATNTASLYISDPVFTGGGNSLTAGAKIPDAPIVDGTCQLVARNGSTTGRVDANRDPATGKWTGTFSFDFPAITVPGVGSLPASSRGYEWSATGTGTQPVNTNAIAGDVLYQGRDIGDFSVQRGPAPQ